MQQNINTLNLFIIIDVQISFVFHEIQLKSAPKTKTKNIILHKHLKLQTNTPRKIIYFKRQFQIKINVKIDVLQYDALGSSEPPTLANLQK